MEFHQCGATLSLVLLSLAKFFLMESHSEKSVTFIAISY